jgi:nicotinamide phosphoribosyltransferase
MNPVFKKDGYKTGHINQYPEKTEIVYSNLTARESRIPGIDKIVAFSFQAFVKKFLIQDFKENFFNKPKAEVVQEYKDLMNAYLGPDTLNVDHIGALHDLGYLPLKIKAVPEGTLVPLRVPVLTIRNTKPEFFWLTNFMETLMSCELWHPMTSATIAHQYNKILTKFAKETSSQEGFVQWQAHDFSMRGMSGVDAAAASGAGHLLSFTGTDTIPAIKFLERYYQASITNELIGGTVPATEHSVMCLGGKETEQETFKRLLNTYSKGIVSVVSDTWDYFSVLTNVLPNLKEQVMTRDGKLVVRPDSGDPVKIICGDKTAPKDSPQYKGTIQLLWETFGGTTNAKGFKELDSHIGCIYGDSITLERCTEICTQLKQLGFASTNIVFGVGSYTYQYVTRDTFGFAIKATYAEIDGKSVDVFKNPKTDSGVKKSAKGLLRVNYDMTLTEQVKVTEEATGVLQVIFEDGKLYNEQSLMQIRNRLKEQL